MLIPILVGVVALSVIIIVHELGHFITAKAIGVKVEEFGIGFPPRLLGLKRGETLYSLNAIPFGGFNKLSGEEDPTVPRSLAAKSIGSRLLVISAGSLMNFLLAFLLFSTVFMIPHDEIAGQVVVEEVAPNSPAAAAGLKSGDIILSVNDKEVKNNSELHRNIQLNLGKETNLLVRHSDLTEENIQVVPRQKPPEGQGAIGIIISTVNPTITRQSYPFWKAIPMGGARLLSYLVAYKDGLSGIFSGDATASFLGPVGIAQFTGEVAETGGLRPLLEFTAFISLLIGIFNLLPLPAIDGGRIFFVLLEWVRRGKRIASKTEGLVHLIGLAMFLVLLLALTYQDIMRIISGESLIP